MSVWDTPTTTSLLDERQHANQVAFIGQDHIKAQVEPFLEGDTFPHMLLTGDPGLGKTQFARWVAWRRQKPFYERLAPVRMNELPPYGVLFLDEVHRQNEVESLFPTMETNLLSFIAATTHPEKLDSAFRSRFLITLRLRPYTHSEMVQIIEHMAKGPVPTANVLAHASSGHPRTAERIVKTAIGLGTWDVAPLLRAVRITADGLSDDHFDYMLALEKIGRPVGQAQIRASTRMEDDAIQRVERMLLDRELIELTPSGRKLSLRGVQYLRLLRDEGVV
jgi:Holliday junction resolvasome RuvABC ATP-dependent DNA helicase subunit